MRSSRTSSRIIFKKLNINNYLKPYFFNELKDMLKIELMFSKNSICNILLILKCNKHSLVYYFEEIYLYRYLAKYFSNNMYFSPQQIT